jgi:two-component system, cell cycle sensor histidine kinase PleC
VIDGVVRVMQPRAQAGEITLSAKLAKNLPRLYADERVLKQILLNLFSNAVKFTPPGGAIEIEAARDPEGGLAVSVRDTGIGMAEDDIPKALEPFQQIDNRLSRKYQGTGLGLSLVKAMIGAHGGSLRIASAPGAGTTVTVIFPAERIVSAKSTRKGAPAQNTAAA